MNQGLIIHSPFSVLEPSPAVIPTPTPTPSPSPSPDDAPKLKGTLDVVTALLRRTGIPMTVREIVEQAGATLPTRSKTPQTVVARDLAMDIKLKGEASLYVRTSPGRFTLRELVMRRDRAQPITA